MDCKLCKSLVSLSLHFLSLLHCKFVLLSSLLWLVQVKAVTQADMCFGKLHSWFTWYSHEIHMTMDLELNTRAFALLFAHIPFTPVGRTKECQECPHILLQVGSSALYALRKCCWPLMSRLVWGLAFARLQSLWKKEVSCNRDLQKLVLHLSKKYNRQTSN